MPAALMIDTVDVFVYGTLLTGEYNHRLWESDVVRVRPAAVAGFRLHYVRGGGYPVMVPDVDLGVVHGEVQTVMRGEGLDWVDRMETGAGYDVEEVRAVVGDARHGVPVRAYVYRGSGVGPRIVGGSWKHRA